MIEGKQSRACVYLLSLVCPRYSFLNSGNFQQIYFFSTTIGWSFDNKRIRYWKALLHTWIRNKAHFAERKRVNQNKQEAQQSRQAMVQQAAQAREAAQQEWERRYEESRQNRVSYEEYQRMKATGMC